MKGVFVNRMREKHKLHVISEAVNAFFVIDIGPEKIP